MTFNQHIKITAYVKIFQFQNNPIFLRY